MSKQQHRSMRIASRGRAPRLYDHRFTVRAVAAKFRSAVDDLLLGVGSPSERLYAALVDISAVSEAEVPEGPALEYFQELVRAVPALSAGENGSLATTTYNLPQEEVRRLILLIRDLAASLPRPSVLTDGVAAALL